MTTQITQKMCDWKRPAKTLISSSTLRAFSMLNIWAGGGQGTGSGTGLGQSEGAAEQVGPQGVQGCHHLVCGSGDLSPGPGGTPARDATAALTWHQMNVLNTMELMSSFAFSSASVHSEFSCGRRREGDAGRLGCKAALEASSQPGAWGDV